MIIEFLINLSTFQIVYIIFSFFFSFIILLLKYQTFIEMLIYININITWFEGFTIQKRTDFLQILIEGSFNLNLFIYILPFIYIFKISVMSGWSFSQHKDWYFLLFFIIFYYFYSIKYFSLVIDTLLHNVFYLEMAKGYYLNLDFNVIILIHNVLSITIFLFWFLSINLLIVFKFFRKFLYLVLYLINLTTFDIFIGFLLDENIAYFLTLRKLTYFSRLKI